MLSGLVAILISPVILGHRLDARSDGGTLYVNELQVLELKHSTQGQTPNRRVQIIVQRLAGKTFEGKFTVEEEGKSRNILLDGRPLVVATLEEAKAHGQSVEALTSAWVTAFKKALAAPAYAFAESPVDVAMGKPKFIKTHGSHIRKAAISTSPTGIVQVTRQGTGLRFNPLKAGTAKVSFINNGVAATLSVKVIPLAAKFPQSLNAEVLGLPPEADVFKSVVEGRIRHSLQTQGENVSIKIGAFEAQKLKPGERSEISIPVTVESDGHAISEGLVSVLVRNVGVGIMYEDLLWYSNVPENLKAPGQLYYGKFDVNQSIRLLIHHCNKSTTPMMILYTLVNESPLPAKVAVINGDVAGHNNPTFAGYIAGETFFRRWLSHSAQIITIPPNSVLPLFIKDAPAGDTVSGLASLRLLEETGGTVSLVAHAMWKSNFDAIWKEGVGAMAPWNRVAAMASTSFDLPVVAQPKEVYADPNRHLSFEYAVGGMHTFLRIGQEAISGTNGDTKLLGNFGANYIIKGTVTNPTSEFAVVDILFEASAGYSGAIFRINGIVRDGRLLQAKEKMSLMRIKLSPGETKPITMHTIPLSGAHYPATIIVQPADYDSSVR